MTKKSLLIIAPQGFQDIELNGIRKGLTDAGFEVVLASTEVGECTGKFGAKEQATVALRDVKVNNYDRIGYIGGPGARALLDDPEAIRIARETVEAKKPLGAICIAPLILGRAGVLEGIEATVWNEDGLQGPILENDGAIYTGEPVVVDGLIVTGEGPEVAEEFGRVFAGL